MEHTEVTIQILQKIQETLVGLREDTNARFREQGERLASLERHAATTNESLAKLHDDVAITNETLG